MQRYLKILRLLQWRNINFKRPPKKSILIYDREGSSNFIEYLKKNDLYILDTRLETLNIYILFSGLLRLKFSHKDYLEAIICCVKPKCILTYIDNNEKFYLIKERFPEVVTVFVQNGTRGEIGDVFGRKYRNNKLKVDFMLVHGDAIGKKYESLIQGKAISIGSLKNNLIPLEKKIMQNKHKRKMMFISTYTVPPISKTEPLWLNGDGSVTYWDQFYEAEKYILPFLKEYSVENNMTIQICGRLKGDNDDEYRYYDSFLSEINWQFLERKDVYSSYGYMKNSDLIVNIDSTLGYEALARGHRVAFLSIRGKSINSKAAGFGWPASFEEEGPIWTNHVDYKSIKRVLNRVEGMSNREWVEVTNPIKSQVMHFDPGNRRFVEIINLIMGWSDFNSKECK